MLTGGCACGRVRYEAEGKPFNATICHCGDCRRSSGAPLVAWFSVPAAGLRFTAGTPRHFASSARAERGFCPDCGTSLTYQSRDMPEEIDIATASLDDPEKVPPQDHTWVRSQLSWIRLADDLPRHVKVR
ncbi:GFA family protein [Roseomonas sp. M0104]|uniref:GFA family protein n=1 Tax=Teichococcus coralli TaxID=2545983 RepID=A0A845B7G3_9PROT|nr:GFA family protein [Pseudoroseomonas coralli]MXP62190.1 GFA family protein [Pseudoroseomonas coralli]